MADQQPTVSAQLAWEAEQGPRVAVLSAAAGVLLLIGTSALQFGVFSGFPQVGLIQGLEPALRGMAQAAVDPRSAAILFQDRHATGAILLSVVIGVGTALLAPPLIYLYRAAAFRRPQTPRLARSLALAAPLASGLVAVAALITVALAAHDFAHSADHSRTAADNLFFKAPGRVAVSYPGLLAQLALAAAFVLISLNAMRAGLLSRFMGVLGILVGVLFVLPQLGSPLPIVQAFWLFAVAVLVAGRWPSGTPPAWASGQAAPWPSQAELRAEREAAREQAHGGAGTAATDPADAASVDPDTPAPAPGPEHPSSKKRKRKRRS